MDMARTPSRLGERAMSHDVAESMASVLRALAEPLRMQIVSALAVSPEGTATAGELASLTDLTAPTVSHHLKQLREAGVLVAERRGTSVHYALGAGMDRVVTNLLDALSGPAARGVSTGDGVAAAPAAAGGADVLSTETTLTGIAERLAGRFPDLDTDLVVLVVRESYAALARTARVTQHLPVLAERFAAQRLEDVRRATTDARPHRPQVLFVCVANAGRSQLAAALLRTYAGDAVVVRSAGSMPAAHVHATVQPLLAALLADQPDLHPFPKPLTDDAVRAADVVITMGCGDTCPVLPGKRYEDWAVGDPALASPAGVRAIYDEIEARVRVLATELTAPPGVADTEEHV